MLVFQIEANAFLWKMVRTITGTLINLDKKTKSFTVEELLPYAFAESDLNE